MDKAIGKLSFAAAFLAAVAVFVMFVFMLLEILGRSFFNHPFGFPFDVAEIMLLLLFYLPMAMLLREGRHIHIDLVTSRLRPRFQRLLEVISISIGLIWSAVMIWLGVIILRQAILEETVSQIWKLPLYPFIWVIPCGGALLFLALVLRLAQQIRQLE